MSSAENQDLLIGRLAIHFNLLTKEQVAVALRSRRDSKNAFDLGTYLVMEDYLTVEQLQKLQGAKERYLEKQQGSQDLPTSSLEAEEDPGEQTRPALGEPGEDLNQTRPGVWQDLSGNSLSPDDTRPAVVQEEPAGSEPGSEEPAGNEAAEALGTGESTVSEAAREASSSLLRFGPETTLEELLRQSMQLGASDLHLHSGTPIRLRLHGKLQNGAASDLTRPEVERLLGEVLSPDQQQRLEEERQLDFAFAIAEVGRFRAAAYHQQRGLDVVFRTISLEPPTLESLGLPASLESLTKYHQGIVLLTGPAGCGKSSTMAALVRLINERRPDHIITVEDPIEFVHPSQRCVVNQRQVGPHTESFARALRAALREDPDIIVIGELRDLETISLALTAAETGHLVLATLHTSSAIRTINRLLGVFPPEQQAQIRTMVSESLRAIVSQRLLRRADGEGQVAALEVLINNTAAGNLIRENKTFQIQSIMQTGTDKGMCLLDASLSNMVRSGTITKAEALEHAEDPKRFA